MARAEPEVPGARVAQAQAEARAAPVERVVPVAPRRARRQAASAVREAAVAQAVPGVLVVQDVRVVQEVAAGLAVQARRR